MVTISPQEMQQIVTNPERADLVVKYANSLGQELSRTLNTSQIRALFGEVRQIEGQMTVDHKTAWRRLHLLKPKMAYRVRRAQGAGVRGLVEVLNPAVDEVLKAKDEETQKKYFKHFVEFFEAILAYHKYHGGN
ncbi:MAG: type III-A CRISPR-associated protein Csm2 [Anaerolineae bacterium]|jgi:CRISPR-associated protein Csm2|nr:type III-A CRISPR-associated protein Csm2 [Anaerolineae bacterium]